MTITSRIFARLAMGPHHDRVDLQALVERLILFDRVTVSSVRLKEIPQLIRAFGYDGTRALLNSPRVAIHCDVASIGQIGQARHPDQGDGRPLPAGSYEFAVVRAADHKQYVSACLKEVHEGASLGSRKGIKLKEALARRLLERNKNEGLEALHALERDIREGHPILRTAILLRAQQLGLPGVDESALQVHVYEDSEREFRVETNVAQLYGLSEGETHTFVERALLGVGGVNQVVECMRYHGAVTTFRSSEVGLLERRMDHLTQLLDPESDTRRFRRVVALGEFPDLQEACHAGNVRIERVLEIAESAECHRFRQWLAETDSVADADIRELFGSTRDALARAANGATGKLVRWVASTGMGLIPGAGTFLGAGAGLLDTFLIERILPRPGPISFLASQYRSVFE